MKWSTRVQKGPLERTKRSTITVCLINDAAYYIDIETVEDLNRFCYQLGHACSKITKNYIIKEGPPFVRKEPTRQIAWLRPCPPSPYGKMGGCQHPPPPQKKTKRLCIFSGFGLTSFYLSVFTSFWYQTVTLFKRFLMVCFIRV